MSTDINKYCVLTNNNIRKNNKYLLSASLFYIESAYKNVEKYINGLNVLIDFINKYKYYTLRLYYDNSIGLFTFSV